MLYLKNSSSLSYELSDLHFQHSYWSCGYFKLIATKKIAMSVKLALNDFEITSCSFGSGHTNLKKIWSLILDMLTENSMLNAL